jgi:outer membrane protein TolC
VVPFDLRSAIEAAVTYNPDVGIALERIAEQRGAVGTSRAALLPQFTAHAAYGPGLSSQMNTLYRPEIWRRPSVLNDPTTELGINGRLLLWDFGVVRGDVKRSEWTHDAARQQALDAALVAAYQVTDIYLRIQEQRELKTIYERNIVDLKRIADLVRASQTLHNATMADVSRMDERLSDAETTLADINMQLNSATDEFQVQVHQLPGDLRSVPDPTAILPVSVDAALERLVTDSPSLVAQDLTVRAARAERLALGGGYLPKVELSVNGGATDNAGQNKGDVTGTALVTVTQRLGDGGALNSSIEQSAARFSSEMIKYRRERDRLEVQVRQAYVVMAAARGKAGSIDSAVAASEKARSLYNEQFAGGKRSLLELLDVQTAYVTARRNAVSNRFSRLRSAFVVLRILGGLHPAALTALESPRLWKQEIKRAAR